MRRKTDFIVVHCSASGPDSDIGVDEIDQWHKDRGWDGIGYHAVIRRSGEIEFGRHFDVAGSHVKGQNYRSVGLCLVGGVDERGEPENNFTHDQFESLRALLDMLQRAYPNAAVLGHRFFWGFDMKMLFALLALALSGCAQWNQLSDGEKAGIIIGTSVLVGASIIKNSEGDVNNCISTRSIRTGCPEF
jgi:N-acetylmuramoyl-L-alanine amidase